ncbi:MAG: hypothetical protein KGM98_01605 [Bacteroidota bacterium]|nr:hypothetical protein [Bacteroidota bacterium]
MEVIYNELLTMVDDREGYFEDPAPRWNISPGPWWVDGTTEEVPEIMQRATRRTGILASTPTEGEEAAESPVNESSEDLNSEDQVSREEIEDLESTENSMSSGDEINLRRAALDQTDQDGTSLNEEGFKNDLSGDDLDVPGVEQDDANEMLGEEDEENNDYSLGGENHDETPTDSY